MNYQHGACIVIVIQFGQTVQQMGPTTMENAIWFAKQTMRNDQSKTAKVYRLVEVELD